MLRKIIFALFILVLSCHSVYAAIPETWYSMDENLNVWRETPKGRVKADAQPNQMNGTSFFWFQADSAVWICDAFNLEHAPVYIPLRQNETCRDVFMPNTVSIYILVLSSEIIAAYDSDGRQIVRTPGIDPVYWADDYRFAYTSCVPGTKRGRGKNAHTWRGVSVFEIFPDGGKGRPEVLIVPVKKASKTADYTVSGVEGNECIMIRHEGSSEEEIRAELPAAG